MEFKNATMEDFDVAFDYIEKLWTYNTYDKEVIRKVYEEVITDDNSFAFFCMEGDEYHGFCHGDYFNTFWMSGLTCYVSSIITNEEDRGKGYGKAILKKLAAIAVERGCGRLEWSCLDWNKPSIDFYRSLGAVPMDEWTVYRVTGETLKTLAKQQKD